MKLRIVGSGGMFQIPNPFCRCPICEEARLKRGRYERLGPSIYIEDIQMLIDTPEDIGVACDRQGVSEIKYLSISHKDPDHTRGMRIVEPLGYDCIANKGTPIQFIALPEVVNDINAWNGDGLYYYQDILHCISINRTDYIKIGNIQIHLVNNKTQLFFASTFSSKMQIDFLKVAWGISPVLHFLRRHSFGCRRGAVAGIQSLLVTDM